jgi:hypothetical protein
VEWLKVKALNSNPKPHTHTRDHFIYIAKPNDRIVQARVRRKGKKYEPEFILEEF